MTRREVGNLEKDILFGKTPGKRERGRSATRCSDLIDERIGSEVRAAPQTQNCGKCHALLGLIWS